MVSRNTIPVETEQEILYRADLQCCVCNRRGAHIHHIDGNPANNDFDNLVLLCFQHHDEVEKKGGIRRKLSPDLLKRYRDEWYDRVRIRRERQTAVLGGEASGSDQSDVFYQLSLDASIALEAERLARDLADARGRDWDEQPRALHDLESLCFRAGIRGRNAILEVLQRHATYARAGMPGTHARILAYIAYEAVSLPHPDDACDEPTELQLHGLEVAAIIGRSLAWDGAKKLKDLEVLEAGGDLLRRILWGTRRLGWEHAEDNLTEVFEELINDHYIRHTPAAKVLNYQRASACQEHLTQPDYPAPLVEKIYPPEN